MLLLLDNFEHLLVGADLVAAVLEAAPGVKILATSRERLNLQAEMVFPLDGMAYPQDGSTADATDYSAVKLFLQSATHVQPDFPVTAQNLTAVAHICRLVQGMPLGILLAAAWVAVLSVQEIAQEIQRSLNFLETDQRDLPERQRSLQAAFDHSWKLLTEGEREVFKRLSVFRGSFTREAAQYVAGTSLKTLMALVNKSLLRRDAATGRYDIHELLRQYGEVQLNALPQESEHIRNLHGTYYADYMRQQSNALRSLREGAVLDEIALEFNNVLEGWNYAVEKRRSDIFRGMAYGLWRFYDLRLSHPEAASLFGRAAEALQAGLPEKELETALGLMLVHQGYFIASNPKLALQGKAITEKGLTRLLMYDCSEEIVMALLHLARVNTMFLGQVSAGKQAAQDALDIARKIDFQSGIASSLVHLGYAAWSEGDWTRAVQLGEECLRVAEGVGELRLMAASAVMVLGAAAIELHDYRQAERQFDQGLRWFKELADPWGIAVSYSRLGKVALMSQDYERSNYWFHESLGYHKQSGQRSRQYYETLYDVSRLYAALGRKGNAVKFLSLVAFEARDSYTGGLATAALDDLRTILSAEDFAVACERGKVLDLDAVVQELLQDI